MGGTIEKNVRLSKSSKQRESERGLSFFRNLGESQRKWEKLREIFFN